MKQLKRMIAMLLAVIMLVPMFAIWNSAEQSSAVVTSVSGKGGIAPSLSGETKRIITSLYNGVTKTYIETSSSSKYNLQKIHAIEFDLSQTDLYVDVTNESTYANTQKSTLNTVNAFNKNNGEGKTAIAAINGDLWMTNYAHSRVQGSGTSYGGFSDAVVTKVLTLPRGFNVYEGEIVCSAYMVQETPFEGEFWSFGVTNDYVPMIGCPELDISITNVTAGKTVEADGLNRLPANNALVVYSDKGCLNNYALSDAYEVVIDVDYDYTVAHNKSITGKVVGIYSSNTATNPTMQSNRIILTARGTALSKLTSFKTGDTVTLDFEVTERYGRNAEGWQNVYTAVGGQMPFVVDGVKRETNTNKYYPATIVGIQNDGDVTFIVNDGRQEGHSKGFNFRDYWDIADDFDLNTAFILDGGGSTNLVELGASGYSVTNKPSDGSARNVVNSVILSAGPKRSAQGNFEVEVPSDNIDLTNLYFASDDAYKTLGNFSGTTIEKTPNGAKMSVKDFNTTVAFAESAASISYGLPNTSSPNPNSALADRNYPGINASDYPYVVYDMELVTKSTFGFQFQTIKFSAGTTKVSTNDTAIGNGFNNAFDNSAFCKYILNPAANAKYTGRLNSLRLGYISNANGVVVTEGDYVILRSARLAKTYAEAQAMTSAPSIQTVTFNPNGGSIKHNVKYAVKGQSYGLMPVPFRDGYNFLGWYSEKDGGNLVTEDDSVSSANSLTLYAHWEEKPYVPEVETYSIIFNTDGGSLSVPLIYEIEVGDSYASAIGAYPTPVKTGYDFLGWYCAGADYYLDISDIHTAKASYTFVAQWSRKTGEYITTGGVNLRSGPGTSNDIVKTLEKSSIVDVIGFSGSWAQVIFYTNEFDENGIIVGKKYEGYVSLSYLSYYGPGYERDNLPGIPDETLVWKRLCEFTIDPNGGYFDPDANVSSGNVNTSNVGFTKNRTEPFRIYVYEGANTLKSAPFSGFYGVVYADGKVQSEGFFTLSDLMTVIYNSLKLKHNNLTNLLFMGSGEFTPTEFQSGENLVDQSILNTENYTFTATWEVMNYILTFDPDGGVMPEEYDLQYVFNGEYRFDEVIGGFPVPTKEGYRFAGWERDADLWTDGWGTQPYTFNSDVTLTARWKDAAITDDGVIVEENGIYYLEVDGERQEQGLYNVRGDYYYVKYDKTLACNETLFTMYNRNVLSRAYRKFGDDCKMMKNGWLELKDGAKLYFIDGDLASGVTKIEEDYYFFNINNGEMRSDADFYIGENNYGIVPGVYHFGEDGRVTNIEIEAAVNVQNTINAVSVEISSGMENYIRSTKVLAQYSQTASKSSETQKSDGDDE